MVNLQPTGILKEFVNPFNIAAQILILAAIERGEKVIVLDQMYYLTGANDRAQKTGVRYAVRHAKAAGIIAKTSVKGVYQVV